MEFIDMNMSHLDLQNAYHPDAKEALQKQNDDIFEYGGQGKPELLLENENINIENSLTKGLGTWPETNSSPGFVGITHDFEWIDRITMFIFLLVNMTGSVNG